MKELNEAKVLAVGPGGLDKEGKRVAPSVQPGDKVLIPQVCNQTFEKDGQALKEECMLMRVLMVLVWREPCQGWR